MERLFSPQTRFLYEYNNNIYCSNTNQITALTEMAKTEPTVTITKCVLLLAVQKYNSVDIVKARIPPPPFLQKKKQQQKLPHTHIKSKSVVEVLCSKNIQR